MRNFLMLLVVGFISQNAFAGIVLEEVEYLLQRPEVTQLHRIGGAEVISVQMEKRSEKDGVSEYTVQITYFPMLTVEETAAGEGPGICGATLVYTSYKYCARDALSNCDAEIKVIENNCFQ